LPWLPHLDEEYRVRRIYSASFSLSIFEPQFFEFLIWRFSLPISPSVIYGIAHFMGFLGFFCILRFEALKLQFDNEMEFIGDSDSLYSRQNTYVNGVDRMCGGL
jgi:hypothetical protein